VSMRAEHERAGEKMPIQRRQAGLFAVNETEIELLDVEDRKTDELVIGFVGPIGSGISFCANIFSQILRSQFGYAGDTLKVSNIISKNANLLGEPIVVGTDERRTEKLQKQGTSLRKTFGNTYLIEKIVAQINMDRGLSEGLSKSRRHFTIVDSIKHPDEVQRLREIYGETFWLIGVFAPEEVRRSRIVSLGRNENYVMDIFQRDEDEGIKSGQRVRDAMFLVDFFIRNDGDNDINLRRTVERFLDVMFAVGVQTPTKDESAMYAATSAAAESACLSRQVGAVITNRDGEIIGMGNNDVPKFGGGLYSREDGDEDHRCFQWRGKICHNDSRKEDILSRITKALRDGGVFNAKSGSFDAKKQSLAIDVLGHSDIRNLIEFSRAVHAEMEAIISVARTGRAGLIGGTLYSTTFPCHSCARHIVAAGIERVIYIEPYTKSLALNLHEDSISIHESDIKKKVIFLQYEGVSPRNMIRLFKDRGQRKMDGKLLLTKRAEAKPVSLAPLDGFEARERLVVARLSKIETAKAIGGKHA
jgi:deoxycytidylate deaminase